MEPTVLIPLIFAGVFLLIDVAMFIRMILLVKRYKDGTAEELGNKLNPYMYATGAESILMAICMILVTVLR